ncbi:MAG: peptidase S10 [Gammaproteobacteria bacterium]|nr:peptidase S10 [Gammaproteobacteria bacterium]
MNTVTRVAVLAVALALSVPALADKAPAAGDQHDQSSGEQAFKPQQSNTAGSVTVEGQRIDYQAIAGTLVLTPEDLGNEHPGKDAPTASMFYVYYAKKGGGDKRPITFLYNGGPGSATIWLHMGAFGPRRVVTADDTHTPAAPYQVVNNDYSLLDASDLVFIDAPATGFSRVKGKDADKTFFGIDGDGKAFAAFITKFLSTHGRWNSPKYLFGESYGTTRSAVLANLLGNENGVDLNGIVLLSQILAFANSPDYPQADPSVDQGYVLALPTYAATAWYHDKLPNKPAQLEPFLQQVEAFALGEYMQALSAGSTLSADRKQAIAGKLHDYTGLPADYWMKADLRVNGGQFEHELLNDQDMTTGRLDTRFSGPSIDPLGEQAEYDPQASAISSAYIAAFNDYVRKTLDFGKEQKYLPLGHLWRHWDFRHQPPGAPFPLPGATNVMPDLAAAMKQNPTLKILLTGGYFDLATPFFEGVYEMHHLPIPDSLQKNIDYHYYESGHMVYAHQPSLKQLHDDVAAFIARTDNLAGK